MHGMVLSTDFLLHIEHEMKKKVRFIEYLPYIFFLSSCELDFCACLLAGELRLYTKLYKHKKKR